MLTVVETPEFVSSANKVWSDDERIAFIDWISENPMAGDVIVGSGGLRKVRWSRHGQGRRGGARVIYYTRMANGMLVLLIVYAKSAFDNLRPEFLKKLKEKFDESED